MNARQQQFVREYLIDLNATQAAIRAGYSEKTANRIGSQLLSKLDIAAAVSAARAARGARTDITADRVLQEVARLAYSDIRELFDETGRLKPIHELSEDAARTIGGVDVARERTKVKDNGDEVTTEESVIKVKMWDKTRNLELLARHLGLLKDRVSLENPDGSTFAPVFYLPDNGRHSNG